MNLPSRSHFLILHFFSMVRRSRNSMLLTSNGKESFSGWVYEVVAAFLDKFSSWLTQMEERCFQGFKRRCFFADACEWQAHIQYFLVYLWILIKEGRLIAWRGVWGNVISFYNINSRQIDGKTVEVSKKLLPSLPTHHTNFFLELFHDFEQEIKFQESIKLRFIDQQRQGSRK